MKCYNKLRRNVKKYEWSYEYPHCIICKSTKYKHHGKGICVKCRYKHDDIYRANQLRAEQNPKRIEKKKQYRRQADILKRNGERIKLYYKNNPNKKLIANAMQGTDNKNIEKQIEALKKEIKEKQNEN